MPLATTTPKRIHQIARWLSSQPSFETPYPTSVRVVGRRELKIDPADASDSTETHLCGDCARTDDKIYIRLGSWLHRGEAIETLLHEWAHAATMREGRIEDLRLEMGAHDDEWAIVYGRIYRAFNDQEGWLVSRSY